MRFIVGLACVVLSHMSYAVWLDTSGRVESLTTYSHTDTILINLSSSGTAVQECSNTSVFAISKNISEEARARMYAMALAAKTAGTALVVSYNDTAGCEPWGGNQAAYRIITRMR